MGNELAKSQMLNPVKEIEYASEAATALKDIVDKKPKKVMVGGEQYIEFEDWQMIARFYNCTAGIEWTKPIMREAQKKQAVVGFEARAQVLNKDGMVISAAEASCLRDEDNWKFKPEFQLRSMAQTRAMAKALRNVFAWVVVLAGYKPTPAEEMETGKTFARVRGNKVYPPVSKKYSAAPTCQNCGNGLSSAEADYCDNQGSAGWDVIINGEKRKYHHLCQSCQLEFSKQVPPPSEPSDVGNDGGRINTQTRPLK
ncbi:hypothetical protein LCGC14_2017610 [marine sediment metagenome]|uniref:Uncharacterized protein n=1 Tax=marine sediment metagenome TaxID=412755 RepID=A0A0F9FKZ1_9ZZZZ|nr:hypothetical protein [Candidatus Scalindua sp.]